MDQIIPFDWQRMLIGDAPPLFLAEIALRVLVIWIWTIALLRWIGGRSISQMSVVEFLLVIALGSAVGDAMFQPDVPLIHAMLVIFLVVCADKAIDFAMRRWAGVKSVVDGIPVEVLKDGRILHDGVLTRNLGATQVMELLRLSGVRNLGEIERAYLEPSGQLSLFHLDKARPGLRIVPPIELRELPPPGPSDLACCTTCGMVRLTADNSSDDCAGCGNGTWTRAE